MPRVYVSAQQGGIDLAAIETRACIAGVSQRAFAPVAQALVHLPLDTPLRELSKSTVGLGARGLTAEEGLLVVVDGGKAIDSAVHAVFGPRALVQRCRVHKKRNVLEKLPAYARDQVSRRLSDLWAMPSPSLARRALESLARELTVAGFNEAGASLREGLPETLTIQHLELPSDGTLIQSLATTNAVESIFSTYEQIAHRVKNWQHGDMVPRWVAAALLKAEKSSHTMGSAAELELLADALRKHAERVRMRSQVQCPTLKNAAA